VNEQYDDLDEAASVAALPPAALAEAVHNTQDMHESMSEEDYFEVTPADWTAEAES
jgi:hypothetical protein